MFDRFTYGARQVVVLAQESARRRGSGQIESSDLLGGILLIPGDDEPATHLLRAAGLSAEILHAPGEPGPAGNIPFAPGAKRALAEGLRASLTAGHQVIAPLHLLIGALALADSDARERLRAHGLDPDQVTADAHTRLATTTLPAAGPIALQDWRPPTGVLPRRGTVVRTVTLLLLAYAACVYAGTRLGPGLLGEGPLVAAAVLAPLVSWGLGVSRAHHAYDKAERHWKANPKGVVVLPPELATLLDTFGMTRATAHREGPRVRSRCVRVGRRACIVLAQAHLNRPAVLLFVLPHEVTHLLRNDARIRRLAAPLLVTQLWLAPFSGSAAAAAVLAGSALLLWAAICWVAELACDRAAVRWTGREAAAAWVEFHRTLLSAEPNPRVRLHRATLGWLTHPPLTLRAALLRAR